MMFLVVIDEVLEHRVQTKPNPHQEVFRVEVTLKNCGEHIAHLYRDETTEPIPAANRMMETLNDWWNSRPKT